MSNLVMNASNSWLWALHCVNNFGKYVSPRGLKTKEFLNCQFEMDMNNPIVCVPERNIGTAFMCAEPAWILSGDNTLEFIDQFAPMERYSDDGMFLGGAYGPKIVDQLPYVVKCLSEDPLSRQAIINIWREKPGRSGDIPCTVCYQFLIRNSRLDMIAIMRSNDIFLGTPYDIFTQTMVALSVKLILQEVSNEFPNLKLGTLTLKVGSLHLYESNIEAIQDILDKNKFEEFDGIDLNYDEDGHVNTFSELKYYLKACAISLKDNRPISHGFLKGLQPKVR